MPHADEPPATSRAYESLPAQAMMYDPSPFGTICHRWASVPLRVYCWTFQQFAIVPPWTSSASPDFAHTTSYAWDSASYAILNCWAGVAFDPQILTFADGSTDPPAMSSAIPGSRALVIV